VYVCVCVFVRVRVYVGVLACLSACMALLRKLVGCPGGCTALRGSFISYATSLLMFIMVPALTNVLWQAEGEGLRQTPRLLESVFACRPESIPAAANRNVTRGLFRVLRELRAYTPAVEENPPDPRVIRAPLTCLRFLFNHDRNNGEGLCKLARDSGMIPVLVDLLKLPDEAAVVEVVGAAGHVLLAGSGAQTADPRKADGFPRAIAEPIISEPPVVPGFAADGAVRAQPQAAPADHGLSHVGPWRRRGAAHKGQRRIHRFCCKAAPVSGQRGARCEFNLPFTPLPCPFHYWLPHPRASAANSRRACADLVLIVGPHDRYPTAF
jgi:hypothetical protein